MSMSRTSKKTAFAVVIALSCMVFQAFAASQTVVQIWQPTTPAQTTVEPYTVYMDDECEVNKIAWKTFSSTYNSGFSGLWRAACYANNNDAYATDLLYSYTFDADDIIQTQINQQPYYLHITSSTDENDVITTSMGCRTKFPVAMTVKMPTGLSAADVVINYVDESCNGYVNHSATGGSELAGTVVDGDPDYLDGYTNTFSQYLTTTDADGYVTFTTWHGGDYTIAEY